MTKITKKEKFAMVMDILKNADAENKTMLMDFCSNEIDKIDKKSKSPKAINPLDKQAMDTIISILTDMAGTGIQAKDLQEKGRPYGIGTDKMSNQKISSLLNKMVGTGTIQKIKDKKVTLFGIDIVKDTTKVEE